MVTVQPQAEASAGLPVQLTSFVGRDADVAAVSASIETSRLVTLCGPGGAGKTRLALAVAGLQAHRFDDGVWWVELANVVDEAGCADTVAAAVGVLVEPIRGPLASVVAHAADRRALLCLDNAEHLIPAAAAAAGSVLSGCPGVTVLVTSREPLGLPGEVVSRVPPLHDEDAVALFVDRARLVRPSFALDASNTGAVRSIITQLDGIPLAVELAAAWLGALSAQQIQAALDDRFRLLVRGPRNAHRRQQTLAGSIDWSHALLDEPDRIVFRRLAVLAGGFGLDGARTIGAGGPVPADEVLPVLARLVDKSLVMADEQGGVVRYRLLETIRAYAAARLAESGEAEQVRHRHLAWCVEFAETTAADRERHPDRWRQALLDEYDNLRAALDWGLTAGDGAAGRRLAASMAWLWHLDRRGRQGLRYLRRAIELAPEDRSLLQAHLLTGVALVADTADPLDVEYDAATRALEIATHVGDENLRALGLILAAVGAFYTDFDGAWDLCEEAHRAAGLGGNSFVLGAARALQAITLHLSDRHGEAEALIDDEVRDHLRIHCGVLSTVLGFQAGGALWTGDPVRALELAEEGLRLAEPLADYLRVGAARARLAQILAMRGDIDTAFEVMAPVLRLLDGADGEAFVPGIGHAMGVLSVQAGEPEAAIAWFERDARSTERGKATYLAAQALPELGAALIATGRPDEAAAVLDRATAAATRLGMPGALAQALEAQADLAALDPDQVGRALDLAHAALTVRAGHGLGTAVVCALEAVAQHGAALKPTADDVRIVAASDTARVSMGIQRPPHRQASVDRTIDGLRRAIGREAFDVAWTEGARLSLPEAAAYASRARGIRGRPTTGPDSLTPTEHEVVRLVVEGLTNPGIAARLFMSRSTVKTHLAHIFAKLGVANRTELATLAVRWPERSESCPPPARVPAQGVREDVLR
jgi:predicted ATPase/DNA-binding NarL/FixJ family response regulator